MDFSQLSDQQLQEMINELMSALNNLKIEIDKRKQVDAPITPLPVSGSLGVIPGFEGAAVKSAFGGQWPLNHKYFAVAETAEAVRKVFGADEVILKNSPAGDGAFYVVSHKERWIKFNSDKFEMNAGVLADYWARNPESLFPNVAWTMAKKQFDEDRAAFNKK